MDESIDVALCCEPADRAAAESFVAQAYELAGLVAPQRFVWLGSPAAGAREAAALLGSGAVSVRARVRTRPWAQARAELAARLDPTSFAMHWARTVRRPWQQVMDLLVTPLRTRLSDDPIGAPALPDAVYGQHDAAWLGAFPDDPALAGLAGAARTTGWWWPFEDVVVMTERPTAVHRDNLGRLHHDDGAALSYPDGYRVHAWKGMPIPPEVADELPHLTLDRIQQEDNAEVRRVMLEHFGFDRYLRECKAKELHRDETGKLWFAEMPGDEPLVMVEVVNATPEPDGTSRTYFLRVPPDIRTARAGVAWTFGLTEQQYAPLVQT